MLHLLIGIVALILLGLFWRVILRVVGVLTLVGVVIAGCAIIVAVPSMLGVGFTLICCGVGAGVYIWETRKAAELALIRLNYEHLNPHMTPRQIDECVSSHGRY